MKRKYEEENTTAPKTLKIAETTIQDIPSEVLIPIFTFCGEFAFICKHVCSDWYSVYTTFKDLIMPRKYDKERAGEFTLNVFNWFANMYPRNDLYESFYKYAAYCANYELFEFMGNNRCFFNLLDAMKNAYDYAALGGQLKFMDSMTETKTLLKNKKAFSESYFKEFKVKPRFAFNNWRYEVVFSAYCNAAKNGHVKVLKWIKKEFTINPSICPAEIAAKKGHLNALKWISKVCLKTLHAKEKDDFYRKTANAAAKGGNLDIIKWINSENAYSYKSWGPSIKAAKYGHLDVLKWMKENGARIDRMRCCGAAAFNGHINILFWMSCKGNGGMDTQLAFYNAVRGGQLKTMQWLFNGHMTYRRLGMKHVITGYIYKSGNKEMIEWWENVCVEGEIH
jgi:hypothetical protein